MALDIGLPNDPDLTKKYVDDKVKEISDTVEDLKKSVSEGKAQLAGTLTGLNVKTASNAEFSIMDTNITTLSTNKYNEGVTATKKGNAATTDVFFNKTFTNENGIELMGTFHPPETIPIESITVKNDITGVLLFLADGSRVLDVTGKFDTPLPWKRTYILNTPVGNSISIMLTEDEDVNLPNIILLRIRRYERKSGSNSFEVKNIGYAQLNPSDLVTFTPDNCINHSIRYQKNYKMISIDTEKIGNFDGWTMYDYAVWGFYN